MIYLNLPVGVQHGWGICGKSIAREIAAQAPARLLTPPFTLQTIGDELEFYELRRLLPSPAEAALLNPAMQPIRLDGPLLQLANKQFLPMTANLRGSLTLAYSFFEDTELLPAHIDSARRNFERFSTGSTWCTEILRRHGLSDVATVLQGVDPAVFFPLDRPRQFLRDRFLVFSGGKFEFRKGQDVVIRAFKALQDRHADVTLVAAWYNQWGFTLQSMRQSQHIRFAPTSTDWQTAIGEALVQNGIDMGRVVLLAPRAHHAMAGVYRNTDVGIFPNRAEGGTNLVLMEYMACGKPVVATNSTGHADVISVDNALVIGSRGEVTSSSDRESVAHWPEPDVEQAIELLEQAYRDREQIARLGAQAAQDLAKRTWRRAAEQFLELLR